MAHIVLFEDAKYVNFLPVTYWRGLFGLRCGRKSLLDNVAFTLGHPVSGVWTRDWIAGVAALRSQIPVNKRATDDTLLLNARWLMDKPIEFHAAPYIATCGDATCGDATGDRVTGDGAIAYIACDAELADRLSPEILLDENAWRKLLRETPTGDVDADLIDYPWELVLRNAATLKRHWTYDDRASDGKVSSSAFLLNPDRIHVGERSDIKPTAVLDAEDGPIFISNDVVVDVHTYIKGPAYIGPGCEVRPHTSIRGGTTLGSRCRVGGEINSAILTGYSNKRHYGLLAHAYVGSWVNFGAGATNSNLKGTYGPVSVQLGEQAVATREQFLGCVIGDFARLGVGQLLPTGAVVGFGALVANGCFAPKHTPSLSWLTPEQSTVSDPTRLRVIMERMFARWREKMDASEEALYARLPEMVAHYGV